MPNGYITAKVGIWQTTPPDNESAIGTDSLKVWGNARTCPMHAVLGRYYPRKSLLLNRTQARKGKTCATTQIGKDHYQQS